MDCSGFILKPHRRVLLVSASGSALVSCRGVCLCVCVPAQLSLQAVQFVCEGCPLCPQVVTVLLQTHTPLLQRDALSWETDGRHKNQLFVEQDRSLDSESTNRRCAPSPCSWVAVFCCCCCCEKASCSRRISSSYLAAVFLQCSSSERTPPRSACRAAISRSRSAVAASMACRRTRI